MELDTIGARLRYLRKQKDMTIEEVARRLNLASSVIGMYEINKRMPPPDKLQLLADFYGVSVDYLLGRTDRVAEPRVPYGLPSGAWEPEWVRIPILGRIHAGDPHWAEGNVEGWTTITAERARSGKFFALRVQGDCMAPARILPGDLVIVRRQPTVEDGEIAVVWWNGEDEAHLRRVRRVDRQVLLTADNPAYPPVLLPPAKVTILGKVVEVRIEPAAAKDS